MDGRGVPWPPPQRGAAHLRVLSDFWRMSAVGALAATLGERDLAVFNSSYRIMWLSLTLVRSVSSAVLIKLGHAFGADLVVRAKRLFLLGLTIAVAILCALCSLVWLFPHVISSIFSNDPDILQLFVHVRGPLAVTVFFMNLAVFLESVLASMGRTRALLILGLISSWGGQKASG